MRRGLVLAGGFVAGVAWELGVLRGLQDVHADLLAKLITADVVVGTSAGSTVAGRARPARHGVAVCGMPSVPADPGARTT